MPTDTFVQNFYQFSNFYLCSIGTKLSYEIKATQSLPLQLGLERLQYISIN